MTDTLLASTSKGLFEVRRHSSGWTVQRAAFVGDEVTLALVDRRDGCWYAALDRRQLGIQLHRSEDDGESWLQIGTPEYPPEPVDEHDGDPAPWVLHRIWALAPAGNHRIGELWAGTIPGGLFRSRDHGQTWTLIDSLWRHPDRHRWFGSSTDLPGIHSVLVDPRDSRRVLVGVSCGGIWETTDDGETWTVRATGMRASYMPPEQVDDPVVQDPHRVVACAANFDRLWTQHRCGIWRSSDGARSWTEIKQAGPSTFGFAVAAHPRDPDTAYFVPAISERQQFPVDARVVVTRTRDGGESFDVLRKGLPQSHAYDLVGRHALDIDESGNLLALGSTTGNLWISEDAGDRFTAVSAHLPPIHALCFV